MSSEDITIRINPPVTSDQLDALFIAAWGNRAELALSHSLLYVCAYAGERLVGFVNMAWDGGGHAFLLDTTVHPNFQRCGIGIRIVKAAVEATREHNIEWVHVDYEPHLEAFYRKCGFRHTAAGLIRLTKSNV